MSSTITPVTTPDGLPLRPLHRDEYFALAESGAFEDEYLELLEGLVVPMSPEGGPHALLIQELTWFLVRALPETGCGRSPVTRRPRATDWVRQVAD